MLADQELDVEESANAVVGTRMIMNYFDTEAFDEEDLLLPDTRVLSQAVGRLVNIQLATGGIQAPDLASTLMRAFVGGASAH